MPVVDSFELPLPPDLQNVSGGVVEKRLMYVGGGFDGRAFTPEFIKQVYDDTKGVAGKAGHTVPIKLTHEQGGMFSSDSEEMKGFLKSIELREEGDGSDVMTTLWGKMHLFPETLQAVKNGYYPNLSIGAQQRVDSQGNMYEMPLEHVALYGANRVNLGDFIFNSIQNSVSKLKKYFSSEQGNKKEINFNMDKINIQNIGQLVEPIKEFADFSNTLLQAVTQLAGDVGKGTKKEPEIPVSPKSELAAISPSEITKAFNSLVQNGNLKQDSREKFDSLVEMTNSIEKSVAFYSDNKVATPPSGTQLASDRDETHLAALAKGLQATAAKMKKPPLSKEELEKVVNATVEV